MINLNKKNRSILLLHACVLFTGLDSTNSIANELQDPLVLDFDKIEYLAQNWNDEDRKWFYHIDQGSRLLPYRIYANLEQSDNKKLFSDPLNMLKYGFLPSKFSDNSLPIGFTHAEDDLGLTCAACHTQLIQYEDSYIHIDGGQAMMDLPLFLFELTNAMQVTLNQAEKYQRFEKRVLGNNANDKSKQALKEELSKEVKKRKKLNLRNHSDVAYGFSRLDAFGNILNKGLLLTGEESNFNQPNAPTSNPYIWDTPQHDYVEWNGSQSNSNVGALARNVGEVIGVFGEVNTEPTKWLGFYDAGYTSSIKASNLRAIEKKVAELHSPLWPNSFPKIDAIKAQAGRKLYESHCLSCHDDIDRDDPKRYIKVKMSTLDVIKTDPLMARNAIELKGKSGKFAGKPRFYSGGPILGEVEPALNIVNNVMIGVLRNNPLQSFLAKRDSKKLGHPEGFHPRKYVDGKIIEKGQEVSEHALLAYKARPLNGVWSSAPYLHNGSVPNLYELLLPAEQRSKTFYIGTWEFDPIKVGYVSEPREGAFYFDTSLLGNSNAGHEYGTAYDELPELSEADRWALLEYLKTL